MYDVLRMRYVFSCPRRGSASVPLSSFRRLERLPGSAHPAVFRVSFACPCGGEHAGLVSHDELDWAPLGFGAPDFVNLLTARLEETASELGEIVASRIRSGVWPWSFFCYPEGRPRPAFPSSFFVLGPADSGRTVGLAVRCPSCAGVSVNVVSSAHVDVPFHNDARIRVVEQVFPADERGVVEEFCGELYSSRFDTRRLGLGESAPGV